jgi:hypothetical protein
MLKKFSDLYICLLWNVSYVYSYFTRILNLFRSCFHFFDNDDISFTITLELLATLMNFINFFGLLIYLCLMSMAHNCSLHNQNF